MAVNKACEQRPWRKTNHGKRSKFGFYTLKNLRRLWNQVRGGDGIQICHLTDPAHPDHVAVGAPKNAKPKECPGSIVLVNREFYAILGDRKKIDAAGLKAYEATRKGGLTKSGILFWVLQRLAFGGVPMIGCSKIPEVEDDPEIGLPPQLEPKTV